MRGLFFTRKWGFDQSKPGSHSSWKNACTPKSPDEQQVDLDVEPSRCNVSWNQ